MLKVPKWCAIYIYCHNIVLRIEANKLGSVVLLEDCGVDYDAYGFNKQCNS